MTPAAQAFYNCLLAHFLEDEGVLVHCNRYMAQVTKFKRKKMLPLFATYSAENIPAELKAKLEVLTDEEWSEAISTFDLAMGQADKKQAQSKGGATFYAPPNINVKISLKL